MAGLKLLVMFISMNFLSRPASSLNCERHFQATLLAANQLWKQHLVLKIPCVCEWTRKTLFLFSIVSYGYPTCCKIYMYDTLCFFCLNKAMLHVCVKLISFSVSFATSYKSNKTIRPLTSKELKECQ